MRLGMLAASIRKQVVAKAPLLIKGDDFRKYIDSRYLSRWISSPSGWLFNETNSPLYPLNLSAAQLEGITEVSAYFVMRALDSSTGRTLIRITLDDNTTAFIGILDVSRGGTTLSVYNEGTVTSRAVAGGDSLYLTLKYKVPVGRKVISIIPVSNYEYDTTPATRGFDNLTISY